MYREVTRSFLLTAGWLIVTDYNVVFMSVNGRRARSITAEMAARTGGFHGQAGDRMSGLNNLIYSLGRGDYCYTCFPDRQTKALGREGVS